MISVFREAELNDEIEMLIADKRSLEKSLEKDRAKVHGLLPHSLSHCCVNLHLL